MSPDHLPHYTKILEDGTDIRLDAAFTLAWNNYDNKERLAEVLNLEQKKNGGKHIMTAGGTILNVLSIYIERCLADHLKNPKLSEHQDC